MNRWLIVLAVIAISPASSHAQADSLTALERARRLLDAAPVFDGHNDLAWRIREDPQRPRDVDAYDLRGDTPGQTDLRRLREGRVGAQFWSVYIPGEYADSGYARVQLEQIDIARRFIDRYPELELALTADDVARIMKAGRIASLLGIEGGHAIENSLGALRVYHELGVRYMTLTHNVTLDWADAAMDSARHGGLTDFGREVVREMNRLGMLIDLSHASDGTMSDALDVTEAPVIFSHSSARHFSSHLRNVPDSILARLPENGGVVMVTFVPEFLSQAAADTSASWEREAQRLQATGADAAAVRLALREFSLDHRRPVLTVGIVADHIEHIRDVAGVEHIGLGGDYDGNSWFPAGMEDVSSYPYLFAELIRRGWNDADLRMLANGNILRVMREAESVAERTRRPPSTKTIDDFRSGR